MLKFAALRRSLAPVAAPSGMRPWHGVGSPDLSDGAVVAYLRRDGQLATGTAAFLGWARRGHANDIVAYRVM